MQLHKWHYCSLCKQVKIRLQVPSTVHADHLLQAKLGAKEDLASALTQNKEVYDFLKSISQRYGVGFLGTGIWDYSPNCCWKIMLFLEG